MRIGLCTTDFAAPMSAPELFQKMKALGFECTQLAFGSVAECGFTPSNHIEIPESVSDAAISAIAKASESTGIPIVAVNGTWNMAHPDKAVRAEGLRRFDGFLRAVKALNCPIVSLCSGTRSLNHLWSYSSENDTESAWADMRDSMLAACDLAEKYDITLAIETEASNVVIFPERARRIMDEVGSPKLKMILDAANLFPAGLAKKENVRPTLDKAFSYFGKDIVLAHGKDIRESDKIDFCATSHGIVDFEYMLDGLRKVDYKGDMLLHGIYDEAEMPACLEYMRKLII